MLALSRSNCNIKLVDSWSTWFLRHSELERYVQQFNVKDIAVTFRGTSIQTAEDQLPYFYRMELRSPA